MIIMMMMMMMTRLDNDDVSLYNSVISVRVKVRVYSTCVACVSVRDEDKRCCMTSSCAVQSTST